MKIFGIEISKIPSEIKDISTKWIKICQEIKDDLNLGIVKAAASYVPSGEADREILITIIDKAIVSLIALKNLSDEDGFKGRFLTLSTQLTMLQKKDGKHKWAFVLHCVQAVFTTFFAKK